MPSPGNARGKYLGFVAHEIKNPLATALWSCDLLKRMEGAERGEPRGEKVVDASLRALRRMRRLVDDYFTVERLQDDALELHSETFDLAALLEGTLQQLVEKDGVAEAASFSRDVPQNLAVRGDGELIRRSLRGMLEVLARPAPVELDGSGSPVAGSRVTPERTRITLTGHAGEHGQTTLFIRAARPKPLIPPPPEDGPCGDPAGATFAFLLAAEVMRVHGGSLEEGADGIALRFAAEPRPTI